MTSPDGSRSPATAPPCPRMQVPAPCPEGTGSDCLHGGSSDPSDGLLILAHVTCPVPHFEVRQMRGLDSWVEVPTGPVCQLKTPGGGVPPLPAPGPQVKALPLPAPGPAWTDRLTHPWSEAVSTSVQMWSSADGLPDTSPPVEPGLWRWTLDPPQKSLAPVADPFLNHCLYAPRH